MIHNSWDLMQENASCVFLLQYILCAAHKLIEINAVVKSEMLIYSAGIQHFLIFFHFKCMFNLIKMPV